jgi:Tol biopolymer transport system component
MNSDGSGQTRLTTDPERDDYPSWSPDGSKIAFNSYRSGQAEIWLMNADASDQHQVTVANDPSFHPVWSPDGQWIAFSRSVSGPSAGTSDEDVFAIKPDGSDELRITSTPGFDNVYSWLPSAPTSTP